MLLGRRQISVGVNQFIGVGGKKSRLVFRGGGNLVGIGFQRFVQADSCQLFFFGPKCVLNVLLVIRQKTAAEVFHPLLAPFLAAHVFFQLFLKVFDNARNFFDRFCGLDRVQFLGLQIRRLKI
ncbi:MAG: hypothetical protein V8R89_09860 [Alphaproteobacteria bacterium]